MSYVTYKFSKELVEINATSRQSKQLRLYKIFDDKDRLAGEFFIYPKQYLIRFNDREITIEVISKFLKKTKHFLVDKKDHEKVGEYEVFGGNGVNHFWQDVPSSPTGTIKLGDSLFHFRRIPPDVRRAFLKPDTWGYFKFRLYAVKGEEFYEYSLKIDIPAWSNRYFFKFEPFVGTIESNADNVFAILAGLYLMELEFEFEDNKTDG